MPSRAELKDQTFLTIAAQLSELGTCDRNCVGAVIVLDGRCVSWGFNGAPPGQPHCDENGHGWGGAMVDKSLVSESPLLLGALEVHGCRNATHAEANALAFAARHGIPTDRATLYVTVSPCDTCARLLIAAGISRVVFDRAYRDNSGLLLLIGAGVSWTRSG